MPVLDDVTLTVEDLEEMIKKSVPCTWLWGPEDKCHAEAHWICFMHCDKGGHTEQFEACHKHKDFFLERDWYCSAHKLNLARKRVEAL